MRRAALAVATAFLIAACAPRNYVVLLDNPEGGSSQVIVTTEGGEQVLDTPGTATSIDRGTKPPSSPWQATVDKLQEVFAKALGARPPRFVSYTLYFEPGTTVVDESSRATYDQMLAEARKRAGADATVAGHADRVSSEQRNALIALLRAYKVRDDLVAAGIPIERIVLDEYGETRPAVPTDDDVSELKNRRVEVTIR